MLFFLLTVKTSTPLLTTKKLYIISNTCQIKFTKTKFSCFPAFASGTKIFAVCSGLRLTSAVFTRWSKSAVRRKALHTSQEYGNCRKSSNCASSKSRKAYESIATGLAVFSRDVSARSGHGSPGYLRSPARATPADPSAVLPRRGKTSVPARKQDKTDAKNRTYVNNWRNVDF